LPSFLSPVSYPAGVNTEDVVTGDFNGDGRLDLAVASYSSNSVSILLGNAAGTFQPAQNFATGVSPVSLAVGDFNGDGRLDLAVANDSINGLNILLGNGDGTFQAPRNVALPYQFPPGYTGYNYLDGHEGDLSQTPNSVAVGDLNGDGKVDLVVHGGTLYSVPSDYSPYDTYYSDNYVNVLLGNGDGSFTIKASYHLDNGTSFAALALGDFNGDGKLDVATPVNGEVAMFPGTGTGTLGSQSSFAAGIDPISVVAGDVNGDGKLDLVTANSGSNDVSVLLGNGDGTLQTARNFLAGSHPRSVAMADFNGDGKVDLAVANPDNNDISLLLGNGDGSFRPANNFLAGSRPNSVAVGDFNGDGFPDLAVANNVSNNVSVLLNATDWSRPQASSLTVSGFPSSTTAGAAGSFTVTAKNADGSTATGYTGTIQFTSSDGKASLPANYTFSAADAGVHTFSATLKTAGTQSITATDTTTAIPPGTEGGITVKPGVASRFLISAPSSVQSGVAFNLTVTVQDAYGNVVTGYTGTIHFTSTDATATLPKNYTFTAAEQGVHTFSSLVLRKRGTQTIAITDKHNSSLTGSVIENVL
jgi:hypothetical protein